MVPRWASNGGHCLWPGRPQLHDVIHDRAALLVCAPLQQPRMLQRLSSGETRIIVPAKDLSLINLIGMTSSIKHPSSNQLHSSATATVMQ